MALGVLAGPSGAVGMRLVGQAHPTVVVDDDKRQCPQAQFTDLRLAAVAAPAGATILVCPGTYPGPVMVTKQLTFIAKNGGQGAGRDPQDSDQQAIVVAGTNGDGFTLSSNSSATTIDGFVVTGGAQPIFDAGIDVTDPSGNGYRIVDNLITKNNVGMYFHSPGGAHSRIEHNAFIDNNEGGFPSPNTGTAIFTQLQSVNDTTIANNFFSGHTDSALNLGDGSQHGLTVAENVSYKDSTFLVLGRATGSVVSSNLIVGTIPMNSAIYLFGQNSGVRVTGNYIQSGPGNVGASGIRLTGPFFGAVGPNTNMTITNNDISNFDYGIRGSNVDHSWFSANNTHDNGVDGIQMTITAVTNTLRANHADDNGTWDCEDQSTDAGTAGTANTWTNNSGDTSNPSGICH
ncbi:MAG TPA: right-handed parallel beta-helix repeat-containing protein [Candidatus Dormibacteraeota bacterium]